MDEARRDGEVVGRLSAGCRGIIGRWSNRRALSALFCCVGVGGSGRRWGCSGLEPVGDKGVGGVGAVEPVDGLLDELPEGVDAVAGIVGIRIFFVAGTLALVLLPARPPHTTELGIVVLVGSNGVDKRQSFMLRRERHGLFLRLRFGRGTMTEFVNDMRSMTMGIDIEAGAQLGEGEFGFEKGFECRIFHS